MFQVGIILDAKQLFFDDLRHVFLDLIVVPFDFLLHVVLTIRTGKVGYDGDRLVGFCFGGYPFIVHHDLAMEYLLFYLLPEVVADTADKLSLREVGDFGGRYQRVELGTDIGSGVFTGHINGFALLEHFPKPFRKVFRCFSDHLPGKDISNCVLDHPRLLITVVTY